MNNINNEKIVDYIDQIYVENKISSEFEDLRRYGEENHVPIIHRQVGEFIKSLINIYKPKRMLEVGTAIGFSSIFFASCSDELAIDTIELKEDMAAIARKNIEQRNLSNRINVIEGDANDVIPRLDVKYDLVFIDAAKGQYIKFFEKIEPILADRALIISDNILYKGMVADDDLVVRRKITIVKRLREYLDMLASKEGYQSSFLPFGDGIALTIKEEGCKK